MTSSITAPWRTAPPAFPERTSSSAWMWTRRPALSPSPTTASHDPGGSWTTTWASSPAAAPSSSRQEAEQKDEVDIIGQFGVGFYSAFMVSDRVTGGYQGPSAPKRPGTGSPRGLAGYEITPRDKSGPGETTITPASEGRHRGRADTSEFLDQFRVQQLVKKYSDYIRYPHPHGGLPHPCEGRHRRGRQGPGVRNPHRNGDPQQA